MTDLNYLSGILACAVLTMVFLGYVRVALSRTSSNLVHHFSLFIILLSLAYILRTVWWDAARVVIGQGAWAVVFRMTDGATANVAFNALAILAGWHGLKALHLMIPMRDRAAWPWYMAWAYPPWCATGARRQRIRRLFRRNEE